MLSLKRREHGRPTGIPGATHRPWLVGEGGSDQSHSGQSSSESRMADQVAWALSTLGTARAQEPISPPRSLANGVFSPDRAFDCANAPSAGPAKGRAGGVAGDSARTEETSLGPTDAFAVDDQ